MTPEDLQEIRHLPSFPRIAEELIQVAAVAVAWVEAIDTAEGAG